MLCRRKLTKRNAEVVGVVESVEEVLVEGVDFVNAGESLENTANLLGNYGMLVSFSDQVGIYRSRTCLLSKFDLSGVEAANTRDLEARADLSGQTPLGSRKSDVQKLLTGRDRRNVLPLCLRFGGRHFGGVTLSLMVLSFAGESEGAVPNSNTSQGLRRRSRKKLSGGSDKRDKR